MIPFGAKIRKRNIFNRVGETCRGGHVFGYLIDLVRADERGVAARWTAYLEWIMSMGVDGDVFQWNGSTSRIGGSARFYPFQTMMRWMLTLE